MTFGEKFWYYASLGWCYFVKIAVKKAMEEGLKTAQPLTGVKPAELLTANR